MLCCNSGSGGGVGVKVAAAAAQSGKAVGVASGRERSFSLSLTSESTKAQSGSASASLSASTQRSPAMIPAAAAAAASLASNPALKLADPPQEQQRKRCFSEGPESTLSPLRYSVRNILQLAQHQPPPSKMARTEAPPPAPDEASPHPQNPEGSIIKDLLLKSRAMLSASGEPSGGLDPAAAAPPSSSATACSFSVSALLNPTSMRPRTSSCGVNESSNSAEASTDGGPDADRPSKKAKLGVDQVRIRWRIRSMLTTSLTVERCSGGRWSSS